MRAPRSRRITGAQPTRDRVTSAAVCLDIRAHPPAFGNRCGNSPVPRALLTCARAGEGACARDGNACCRPRPHEPSHCCYRAEARVRHDRAASALDRAASGHRHHRRHRHRRRHLQGAVHGRRHGRQPRLDVRAPGCSAAWSRSSARCATRSSPPRCRTRAATTTSCAAPTGAACPSCSRGRASRSSPPARSRCSRSCSATTCSSCCRSGRTARRCTRRAVVGAHVGQPARHPRRRGAQSWLTALEVGGLLLIVVAGLLPARRGRRRRRAGSADAPAPAPASPASAWRWCSCCSPTAAGTRPPTSAPS